MLSANASLRKVRIRVNAVGISGVLSSHAFLADWNIGIKITCFSLEYALFILKMSSWHYYSPCTKTIKKFGWGVS